MIAAGAMKELFPAQRVCVVCDRVAPRRQWTLKPGEDSLIGLYVTIYRRGRRGKQLSGSGKVVVCESCLLRVAAEGQTHRAGGRRLADALLAAIAGRVAKMLDEERPRGRSDKSPQGVAA